MSEAAESVNLSAEAEMDLQGEQAPASIGSRAKRGRPSRIEQHVIWDAEPGVRKPSLCKHCMVFAAVAVPEQPAAEAMKQPSLTHRGVDRATKRPLSEADKAALHPCIAVGRLPT